MNYTKGQLVHCSAEFKAYINSVLTYVDPDVVYFKFKRPGANTVTYTYGVDVQLVKSATGKYYVDLDTSSYTGIWYYKFYSTGQYQSAQQDEFIVEVDKV
jgi:hypothetical protein